MATSDPSDGIQQAVYGFLGVGSKAEDGTADVMTANCHQVAGATATARPSYSPAPFCRTAKHAETDCISVNISQ